MKILVLKEHLAMLHTDMRKVSALNFQVTQLLKLLKCLITLASVFAETFCLTSTNHFAFFVTVGMCPIIANRKWRVNKPQALGLDRFQWQQYRVLLMVKKLGYVKLNIF